MSVNILMVSYNNHITSRDTPPLKNPSGTVKRTKAVPGFFDSPAGQIYHVLYPASIQRRGAVLLCGPVGIERERAYSTLVKWARFLAAHGYDTMSFDFRGNGESTGRFEEMTMSAWRKDAEYCAAQLAEISQGIPLILHGSRAGALIAAELFASGVGDALLLWAPPVSGQALLLDTLRRNLVTQMLANPSAPRQTREQLIATLEGGELLNVDGYFWFRNYWTDAQSHKLMLPSETEQRPWHVVQIKKLAKSSIKSKIQDREDIVGTDPFWEIPLRFPPDSDDLSNISLQWLESSVPRHKGSA